MIRHFLIIAALLLLAPSCAFAADMPPQSVEEPDAPDEDSMGAPDAETPAPPVAATEKAQPKPKAAEPSGDISYDKVVLQGLNKVTARAQTLEAPLGSVVRFGAIEIVAHSCWKSAPEQRPENAALLEISEIKQGEAPRQIFLGWMFSSSPGLSSLEHPFYDVTVVRCEKAEPVPAAPAAPPAASAKTKARH